MARPSDAEPVKLFAAAIYAREDALQTAVRLMESAWGKIDYTGSDHSFNLTDYYEPEMGKNLRRRLISFRELFPPDRLDKAKHTANNIEDDIGARFIAPCRSPVIVNHLSGNVESDCGQTRLGEGKNGRLVNLDVGYLDLNKIVLASFKGAGQKIYLGDGVWADMTARYREGRYQPFEWTFPDFREGRYDIELDAIRNIFRRQLAALRAAVIF